jgi:pyrroloquinoline quinone biosynthesis protein B
VLGSAAGGGFPQWNCACALCRAVRDGAPGLAARTQTSVAVSADGTRWFLLCASPDARAQIESFAPLRARPLRGSPIEGVILPNADVDATGGLLSLREGEPIAVHATARVLDAFLKGNALAATLQRTPNQLSARALPLGKEIAVRDRTGAPSGLTITSIPVAGKPPPHLAHREPHAEDNVALLVREKTSDAVLAFVPCAGSVDDDLIDALAPATALLFDGTFWADDELAQVVPGASTARAMAHLPVGSSDGSLVALERVPARTRLFIHVNNTNPMLDERGPERARVRAAGWEVAVDGAEVLP